MIVGTPKLLAAVVMGEEWERAGKTGCAISEGSTTGRRRRDRRDVYGCSIHRRRGNDAWHRDAPWIGYGARSPG